MSTPFRKRGFFYRHWKTGGAKWHRNRARAPECPQIGRAFPEEERRAQKGDFDMEVQPGSGVKAPCIRSQVRGLGIGGKGRLQSNHG
jgi:hypothetical protein